MKVCELLIWTFVIILVIVLCLILISECKITTEGFVAPNGDFFETEDDYIRFCKLNPAKCIPYSLPYNAPYIPYVPYGGAGYGRQRAYGRGYESAYGTGYGRGIYYGGQNVPHMVYDQGGGGRRGLHDGDTGYRFR